MILDLFGREPAPPRAKEDSELHLFQTPSWACEALIGHYFSDLSTSDTIIEPACGEGHFLNAIPASIPAIGIELNPELAAIARARTGREVLVGDVLEIDLPLQPTLILGNPPFRSKLIDGLLDRAYSWLPENGRCGLLLPAFILTQLPRIARESERWSISSDLVPRDLFPGPRLPIAFARFEKRKRRTLVGFALFQDAAAIRGLSAAVRRVLVHGRTPVWRSVVFGALRDLGGEASLDQIYRAVAPRRPTQNPHWKAKIRQVVHHYAERVGPSLYRVPDNA